MDRANALYDVLRSRVAQRLVDALHHRTGIAWHRVAKAAFEANVVLIAVHYAFDEVYAVMVSKDTGAAYVVLSTLGTMVDLLFAVLMVRHARLFSARARRDPFVPFDPAYRTTPVREAVSLFCLAAVAHLALMAPGVVSTMAAVVHSGLPWTDRAVIVITGCTLTLPLSTSAWLCGLLAGGCERPTRGRRRRGSAREARAGGAVQGAG